MSTSNSRNFCTKRRYVVENAIEPLNEDEAGWRENALFVLFVKRMRYSMKDLSLTEIIFDRSMKIVPSR